MENNLRPPLRDRLIPWYFVAMFAVVFIVNGIFFYYATSTHTGLVTEHAYEKGLDYDQSLALAQQQEALGWNAQWSLKEHTLTLQLHDAQGAPLHGARVVAHAKRPTFSGHDFAHPLQERGGGEYAADIPFPIGGQWDLTLTILWHTQQYQSHKRIVIR